jgi:2-dehydro-3-deoxyphosphogluconate aldolase/(4S)-4-hydroxy-2-oxoglutarate aldolase
MDRSEIIRAACETGVVAVVRGETPEQAAKISKACVDAGIRALEITFTVPGAADVIKELSRIYKGTDVIIGAGTVLDPETARTAILAGAQFVVSPYLDKDMVKLCNRYEVAVMPGAMTPKEVVECMEAGADLVKIFPGELFGPKIIKAIRGPLPQAKMIPTGGVNLENVGEWIKAGAVAVGVGGSLTAGAKTGDYAKVTETGRQFIAKVKEARGK